jgi:hypothetical protein
MTSQSCSSRGAILGIELAEKPHIATVSDFQHSLRATRRSLIKRIEHLLHALRRDGKSQTGLIRKAVRLQKMRGNRIMVHRSIISCIYHRAQRAPDLVPEFGCAAELPAEIAVYIIGETLCKPLPRRRRAERLRGTPAREACPRACSNSSSTTSRPDSVSSRPAR